MTLAQWISLVVIALLPAIWTMASYLARIPEQQRIALPIYALMAVQEIEQTQRNINESIVPREAFNRSKKEMAIASAIKHFRAGHLPIPDRDRIEAAIESAVFQLHRPR